MHPGGPARSPLTRNGQRGGRSNSVSSLNNGTNPNPNPNSNSNSNSGWPLSSGTSTPREESTFSFTLGGGSSSGSGSSGSGFGSGAEDVDFLLAVSSDEKLLRRLNEFDVSETVSTSGKGTDGKWKLESEETVKVLGAFADVV